MICKAALIPLIKYKTYNILVYGEKAISICNECYDYYLNVYIERNVKFNYEGVFYDALAKYAEEKLFLTSCFLNVQIDANVLDTFYAKDDTKGFLEKITGDDILYLENKKANKFLTRKGSNCPTGLKSLTASYIVYAKVIRKSTMNLKEITRAICRLL